METIGEARLWSVLPGDQAPKPHTCGEIRKADAVVVDSYMDLARRVAELQYENDEYVLLFRGQRSDYRNLHRNSSIKPSLFRSAGGGNPRSDELQSRFNKLERAEELLIGSFAETAPRGGRQLSRQRLLRWSILQHYEVCATPLLDVTHSLRIAASFAADLTDQEAYVFVIGVPNLSGAITASADAGLQIIRLASVCPPTALRPHIQEGYLLGEYPEVSGIGQKQLYADHEIDFGRRLIAKFKFDPRKFWGTTEFPRVSHNALYPDQSDPVFGIMDKIKRQLAN